MITGLRRRVARVMDVCGRAALKARRGACLAAGRFLQPDLAPAITGAILFAVALAVPVRIPSDAPLSATLRAADGTLLGARTAVDGQWRFEPSSTIPHQFSAALVGYEDRRFYGHCGFDPRAIVRALAANASAGRIVSGASTLTMQLARLVRSPGPRTLAAKLVELWMAVRLELRNTKEGLLARYAAIAPFGANVVGLEAAGFRWFGRPPANCTWAEAATLAVLPNSPGLVHPYRSRDVLKARRDALLERLYEGGIIDAPALESALAELLPSTPRPMPDLVPHLTSVAPPGPTLTHIDARLQAEANGVARRHADRLAAQGIQNLAAVILKVEDGNPVVYIGNSPPGRQAARNGYEPSSGADAGIDYADAYWVDCATAPRSSGSILKPFLYAMMLESGELTPGRLVPDIPTRIGSYSPENSQKTYSGAVRADEALARSLNVPFVRLLRSYGIERFASSLKRLGFTTLHREPADYGLTLILGGAEVTLLEAARAYSTLAGVTQAPAGPLDEAQSRSGSIGSAPFGAGAAWLTLEALVDVGRPGDDASWQEYASSRRIAWKTGTSFGSRDAWAIGVSGGYVVAVWAGNADNTGRPGLRGTDAAAPLMFDLFSLLPPEPWFEAPAQMLDTILVCSHSGFAAGPDCQGTTTALVPSGANPDSPCPYCRLVHLSEDGRYRVSAETAGAGGIRAVKRFVLPPAMEWYASRSGMGYIPLPPWAPGSPMTTQDSFDIVSPEQGSTLYIPVELDGRSGKTVFRALARDGVMELFWELDGHYLGRTRGDHRLEARPASGRHILSVTDEYGTSLTRTFDVSPR